ncbi:hypothetical protein SERLA73DRAFT_172753 [Serpula lacrymans var. lacrymans S7.3]|uniref:OTU domain-containing protein n=1 Tax=Serpula lacrymans var. lacrymans (strain S7.3) TaxID=936435 RepID=F8QGI0_SERL3|nr:hypothetical protein SERLA73DRAFT_172753 [Serpula lacrymans var. lacrymans S7.3]
MGAKKQQKKHLPLRARTTRSKGKVISDPVQNTRLLTEQLWSLGLYAADTLGDGNCLFRALSDQLYGTPSHHLQLRKDICDWIEVHFERYEPFCEDERGLSTHLQCMREQGTYGGHLELSAFAHRNHRNVKVIQPGLVYVIQWDAGGDPSSDHLDEDETVQHEREKCRLLRHQKRVEQTPEIPTQDSEVDSSLGAIYVAYHDWEHFSSIRNLRGPHTGLPSVQELSAECEQPPSPAKKKHSMRVKSKPESKISKVSSSKDRQLAAVTKVDEVRPQTPSQIALPASRSSSPGFRDNHSSNLPSTISSLSPDFRVHRSPKRSFDESSGSSTSEGIAKRTRSSHGLSSQAQQIAETDNASMEDSTPGLSPPGSPAESTRSSSAASSSLPSTPPASLPPEPERPLTRRQRKSLGLPKPRSVLVAKKVSAGKIVIPGGRYKKGAVATQVQSSLVQEARDVVKEDADGSEGEWKRNGTGRVDVRGFRELKI